MCIGYMYDCYEASESVRSICSFLLKKRQTDRGQETAKQGIQRASTESSQVTGRSSGQAANRQKRENNPINRSEKC